jgi:DNA-binding Xre family transcriptional regulator
MDHLNMQASKGTEFLMRIRGEKQKDVYEYLEMASGHFSILLSGKLNWNFKYLNGVCRFFDVHPDELLRTGRLLCALPPPPDEGAEKDLKDASEKIWSDILQNTLISEVSRRRLGPFVSFVYRVAPNGILDKIEEEIIRLVEAKMEAMKLRQFSILYECAAAGSLVGQLYTAERLWELLPGMAKNYTKGKLRNEELHLACASLVRRLTREPSADVRKVFGILDE